MLSAKEARILTIKNSNDELTREMERLEQYIIAAARKGQTSVDCGTLIGRGASQLLRENGYHITINENKQKTTHKINWLTHKSMF